MILAHTRIAPNPDPFNPDVLRGGAAGDKSSRKTQVAIGPGQ
jgi:hypothetical protein